MELQPGDYLTVNREPVKFVGTRPNPDKPEESEAVVQVNPYEQGALHRRLSVTELQEKGDFLMTRESQAWRRILGADVEIKPLPEYVTPSIIENLKKWGFELRYIPHLELDAQLLYSGGFGFDHRLREQYPNWRYYESLSREEKGNPKIYRNLNYNYWLDVQAKRIDFPSLPGQWTAVETFSNWEIPFDETHVANELGFPGRISRFNHSWEEVSKAIKEKGESIVSRIGLPKKSMDLRLLEALEWNLLRNRAEVGGMNPEWTNTKSHDENYPTHLVAGSKYGEGAERIMHRFNDGPDGTVGFRMAIMLKE